MNRDTRMDAVKKATPVSGDSNQLDRLTKSEYGPFLLLSCLFFAGFVMCTGGMMLVVLGGRIPLVLFVLVLIVGVVVEVRERWVLKNRRSGSRSNKWNDTDKWPIVLGWCFPREHREALVGDILEDCNEMRERGLAERRIQTHVLWQWAISVVTLIPTYVMGAISRLWGAK